MPAKRQIKLNRKPKTEKSVEEVKKTTEKCENEVKTPVVNKEEVKNVETKEVEKEIKEMTDAVLGKVGDSVIVKPKGRIKFEAQVAPVPLFKLPADIRQYLINKGFTSDVYKKDKEWLEKHGADMKMIQKLKDFLTEKL